MKQCCLDVQECTVGLLLTAPKTYYTSAIDTLLLPIKWMDSTT